MTKKKPPEDKLKVGRPRLYASSKAMQSKIDAYFQECDNEETKKHYTITGLALYLGFSDKQSLIDYAGYPEFSFTIKTAKARIENYLEQHLFGAAVTGTIFNLKNNFGWKDKREVDASLSITDMRNQLYGDDK